MAYRPPKNAEQLSKAVQFRGHLGAIFAKVGGQFLVPFFGYPLATQKIRKVGRTGAKMEPKREAKSDLLGDLAEESSIRYLLYLKHIGPPRDGPGRRSKLGQDSEVPSEP